jgi:hypothetical protein
MHGWHKQGTQHLGLLHACRYLWLNAAILVVGLAVYWFVARTYTEKPILSTEDVSAAAAACKQLNWVEQAVALSLEQGHCQPVAGTGSASICNWQGAQSQPGNSTSTQCTWALRDCCVIPVLT